MFDCQRSIWFDFFFSVANQTERSRRQNCRDMTSHRGLYCTYPQNKLSVAAVLRCFPVEVWGKALENFKTIVEN